MKSLLLMSLPFVCLDGINLIFAFSLQLFAKFAHPFKLYEAQLQIYQVASHPEAHLIDQVWADIIKSG